MESMLSPQCSERPDWKVGMNWEPFFASQGLATPLPEKLGDGRVGGWH